MSMQKFKVRGQRSKPQRSKPSLAISGLQLHFEFTYGDEIMHRTWYGIEEVPYIVFEGHPSNFKVTQDEKSLIFCLN